MKFKKLLSVCLCVILIFTLAACGKDKTDTSDKISVTTTRAQTTKADDGTPREVTFRWSMWINSQSEIDFRNSLIDKVKMEYPNITIRLESHEWVTYWDRLMVQLSSRSAPDLLTITSINVFPYAARNAFEPLEPFIEKTPELNMNDFYQGAVDSLKHKDSQIGIPYDFGATVIYFNKDLFDKNNVEYPNDEMTIEEFIEKSKALTKANESYGFVFNNYFEQYIPWIWSNGGTYMNDSITSSTLHEPGAAKAFSTLYELLHSNKSAPQIPDSHSRNWHREQFASGNIGMYVDGPWAVEGLRSKASFEWDIVKFPSGSAGSVPYQITNGYSIFSNSRYKNEVWQAITVLVNEENQKAFAEKGYSFPSRKSALDSFTAANNPGNTQALISSLETAKVPAATYNWIDIVKYLEPEIDKIWKAAEQPQSVLNDLRERFDSFIEEHNKLSK